MKKRVILFGMMLIGTFFCTNPAHALKLLSKINNTYSSTKEIMQFTYDDNGRLSGALLYVNDELHTTYTIDYEQSDLIVIEKQYSHGYTDKETYEMQNGVAIKRTNFMEQDNVSILNEFTYSDGYLQTGYVNLNGTLKTIATGTWSDGNLVGAQIGPSTLTLTYTSVEAPLAVGLLCGPMGVLDQPYLEYMPMAAFLDVMGKMSKNLLSTSVETDNDKNITTTYNYVFNSEKDIIQITLTTPSKTHTYDLEWVEIGTGITTPQRASQLTQNVYTINGQLVGHATTSLEGLPKGIYIIDGRKVVKD